MREKPEVLQNFIALEGLDGSGTTTQLNMLKKWFADNDKALYSTCEPTPMPSGKLIRQILLKEIKAEPETLARLFSADRYEHLYNPDSGILKMLEDGSTVLTDRYLFSSLAYQSLGCDFDLVHDLNPYPIPEYTIFLDLSAEVCSQRMHKRDKIELFDALSIQNRIIENYNRAFSLYANTGMKLLRIDGTKKPDEICSEIIAAISR